MWKLILLRPLALLFKSDDSHDHENHIKLLFENKLIICALKNLHCKISEVRIPVLVQIFLLRSYNENHAWGFNLSNQRSCNIIEYIFYIPLQGSGFPMPEEVLKLDVGSNRTHYAYSIKLKKYISVTYSSQGSHIGERDFCNRLADASTTG